MRMYNNKAWIQALLTISKGDTIKKLFPAMLFILGYCSLIAYLEIHYFKIENHPWAKNIPTLHNLLGFAISIILVFRTNTAYDRWWEGRKLWGDLVNCSRNLAIKMASILPQNSPHKYFYKKEIPAYANALMNHLLAEKTKFALDEKGYKYQNINHPHLPNLVAKELWQRTNELHQEGILNTEQLLIINTELTAFTNICGACERIKNTPIPKSYATFIKKFIIIYVLTLPFGYVFALSYAVAPIVAFVFYVLASLELIAEEIEDPFGIDYNDLPMGKLCGNIKRHVEEIFDEENS